LSGYAIVEGFLAKDGCRAKIRTEHGGEEMNTIHAIFEEGVFRPKEPVDLPEHAEVEFEPRLLSNGDFSPEEIVRRQEALERLYQVLDERYDSGDPYGSERIDEHQP